MVFYESAKGSGILIFPKFLTLKQAEVYIKNPHQTLGFHKRARMRHHACENLRAGYRLLILTGEKALGIDLSC